MKLKNIFIALMVVLTAAVACVKEETGLTEIKVSKSFVNIPPEGGSDAITLKTTGDWSLAIKWPSKKVDDKYVDDKWFEVTTEQKGDEEIVTFSAEASAAYRSLDIKLYCNGQTQIIKVAQGKDVPVPATIKEVLAERAVGKQYRLDRVKVLKIKDMTYGQMDITDKTGEVCEIWGFLNDAGEKGKFPEMKIAEGDILNIKATWSSHGNLEKAIKLDHFPSYVSVAEGMKEFSVGTEAKDLEVKLKVTGESLEVNPTILVKEGDKTVPCEWISVKGINVVGSNGIVKLHVAANEGAFAREATVYFVSGVEGKDPTDAKTIIRQEGNPLTIAEAITKEGSLVGIEGHVVAIHKKGFVLSDGTDAIYVYVNDMPEVKLGKNVRVLATVGSYRQHYQLQNPTIYEIEGETAIVHPTAQVATKAFMDEILTKKTSCKFVSIQGKPDSKNWGAITIEEGYTVSPYQILSDFNYSDYYAFDDVILEGYTIQAKAAEEGKPNELRIVVTAVKRAAALELPFEESFKESQGSFTLESPVMPVEGKHTWKFDQWIDKHTHEVKDSYMKANGFMGSNKASESYLISPVISLVGKTTAKLTFMHTGNNFPFKEKKTEVALPNMKKAVSVVIRKRGEKTWNTVEVTGWPTATDYNFVKGEVDLSAYAEQEIQFAFKYTSTTQMAGTWEVKDVKVQ